METLLISVNNNHLVVYIYVLVYSKMSPLLYNDRDNVCSMMLVFTIMQFLLPLELTCVFSSFTHNYLAAFFLCGVLRIWWSQIREFNFDLRVPHTDGNISSFYFPRLVPGYSNAPVVSLEWVEIGFRNN